MFIVYFILNRHNLKAYGGFTGSSMRKRWQTHCAYANGGSKFPIHCAIRKYGKASFDQIVVWRGDSAEEAKRIEIQLIRGMRLRDSSYGYNITEGGDGNPGWKMAEETKRKISNSLKGRPSGHIGHSHSAKTKQNISASGKSAWANKTPEERAVWSAKLTAGRLAKDPRYARSNR